MPDNDPGRTGNFNSISFKNPGVLVENFSKNLGSRVSGNTHIYIYIYNMYIRDAFYFFKTWFFIVFLHSFSFIELYIYSYIHILIIYSCWILFTYLVLFLVSYKQLLNTCLIYIYTRFVVLNTFFVSRRSVVENRPL